VASHHLDVFLRAWAAGLLRPASGLEVRRVSCRPVPSDPKAFWISRRIPHDAVQTLQRFPLVNSRTRVTDLPKETVHHEPLPSCRCRPGGRSNAMKLRSAEADPHVIARDQILMTEATGVHSRCEHPTEVDGAFRTSHC
jgi:hypothetical protein